MSETNQKGMFIVIEGVDGVGKTTQIKAVAELLRLEGYEVVTTREPGGSEFGESLRGRIMMSDISKRTEALIFSAIRSDHLETVIKPAVEAGKIVLCDRYIMSSMVYQGLEGGQSRLVEEISNHFSEDIKPDVTIILSAKAESIFNRKGKMSDENKNRLDPEDIDKALSRCKHYMTIADSILTVGNMFGQFGFVAVVDADRTVDEVTCNVVNEILFQTAKCRKQVMFTTFVLNNNEEPEKLGRGTKFVRASFGFPEHCRQTQKDSTEREETK